jgi:UDP-3-O-[3-hydroxymyristoyl] glucosamine N-acyltransferase
MLQISVWKTLYVNLRYLPFSSALKLPIIISRKVYLKQLKGTIHIKAPIKPSMIKIGFDRVGIFDYKTSRTILDIHGLLTFENEAFIGHGSKISVAKTGELTLGHKFSISAESTIVCRKQITFGQNCLLSWDILVVDTDFHGIYSQEDNGHINPDKEIFIGNNVWIGCRSLILKGSRIPSGAVIAAHTTLTGEHQQEGCIYGGSPAKILKEHIYWKL